jgi:ribosomal-protein-alanine N-acetyltransferase
VKPYTPGVVPLTVTSSPAVAAEGLHVRKAEPVDLLAVQQIEAASFSSPWPYSAFERFLGQPGFLVAEEDGSVVGFVVADIIASHGRPVGHVKNLAVHPDRRGEGVATTLLSRVMMVLTGGGVDSVKLEVRADNEAARSLYDEFGFDPVHELSNYYEDGTDAVVLVSEFSAGD